MYRRVGPAPGAGPVPLDSRAEALRRLVRIRVVSRRGDRESCTAAAACASRCRHRGNPDMMRRGGSEKQKTGAVSRRRRHRNVGQVVLSFVEL